MTDAFCCVSLGKLVFLIWILISYSCFLPKVTALLDAVFWKSKSFDSSPNSTIFGFWFSDLTVALDRNCLVPFFRKGFGYLLTGI